MTGKTHRIIGLVAGGAYFLASAEPAYQPATFGAVIFASYFGSLMPDIDNAGADIWHTLPFGHAVGKVTDPILQHRNFSHSALGICAYGAILYLILKTVPSYWGISIEPVMIASMIAYASHLLSDSITVEGIPLLWPWQRMLGIPPRPFEGVRIQTGKWFENLVVLSVANIVLIVLVVTFWDKIQKIIYR